MNILLIAGHGQGDPGAVGNGYKEADLAREVVNNLRAILVDYADVVVFDISKNMYKYLKSGKYYNFNPYDYILEIHFNAGGGNGTEILVHKNQKGVSVEQAIVKNISALGFKNRGVKRRSDLQNMNIIFKNGKDYALLETCFIDSASDVNNYQNKSWKVAQAIANGIISGFGLKNQKQPTIKTQELITVNDIVWELSERGIITNKELWLDKLNEDENVYWLARKCVNYIRENVK